MTKIFRFTVRKIILFAVLFAAIVSFSEAAWADADDNQENPDKTVTTETYSSYDNTVPNGSGYANKSSQAPGRHIYKHPGQPSFTSPFDYGSHEMVVERNEKCNCFTFDATKSYEIDGPRLSFMWDFGDGQTSEQAVVQHCYEKSGSYNVTLTAKDSSGKVCDTGVASSKVEPSFPAQANAGPEQQACLNESMTFNGGDSEGGPFTYTWDFGDGETAQGKTVNHTYKQAGQYRVMLTVDNGKNTQCSVAQSSTVARVYQNAMVTLQAPQGTCIGRTVTFESQGTGGKSHWDFGDGQTWDGGSRASHTYTKTGTYNASVTVDDGRGSKCSIASSAAKIQVNEPPMAKISDVETCLVNDAVDFDASKSTSANGNLSYLWNFGDGETAEGKKAEHTYKKSGSYRVVLTVKDSSGGECGMSSDSVVVSMKNRPEAVINIR